MNSPASVRLGLREEIALELLHKKLGKKKSQIIRMAIMELAKREGLEQEVEELADLLVTELLNKISRGE